MTPTEKRYLFNELKAIRKTLKTMAAHFTPSMRQLIKQNPGLGDEIGRELKRKK